MGIEIKEVKTVEELQQVAEVEERTWGSSPIPVHQTLTVAKNGGVVLAAWDGGDMVGFLYSFPGFQNGETYLCSHMLAVSDSHRNRGIGYELKMEQRAVATHLGYRKIRWTYDPLESKNAYLNIVKLGAICSDYIVNCYGEMEDELNKGLPSDRFNVEWLIQSPHVEQRQQWITDLAYTEDGNLLDWQLEDGLPVPLTTHLTKVTQTCLPALFVPVPNRIQAIKKANRALALDWRLKTREVLQHAFAHGWAVAHVLTEAAEDVHYYALLQRSQLNL